MAAVTGAIWKCATDSYENVERFEELDLVKLLVNILKVKIYSSLKIAVIKCLSLLKNNNNVWIGNKNLSFSLS